MAIDKLTDIACRLRVISTSLIAIAGFIALGMVIDRISLHFSGGGGSASSGLFGDSCPGAPEVPYIRAAQCGGHTSCDWNAHAPGLGRLPTDAAQWASLCKEAQTSHIPFPGD